MKNKLQLKETKRDNPETVLLKAFKYHDLDNSNDVDRNEWTKALNGIGVTGFTEEMLKEFFDKYDTNGNGKIEYKEFISVLFGNARVQVTETKNVKQEIREIKGGKSHKEFSKTKKYI